MYVECMYAYMHDIMSANVWLVSFSDSTLEEEQGLVYIEQFLGHTGCIVISIVSAWQHSHLYVTDGYSVMPHDYHM